MTEILNNPWVIGIGVTIIGGFILYRVFGVGRIIEVDQKEQEGSKRIGILNKGKNNQFIDNSFENLDVGFKTKVKIRLHKETNLSSTRDASNLL